jgi:predicted 3-demethylubiquinone-9 3-methyltransferase (glyoxalase superfamily)
MTTSNAVRTCLWFERGGAEAAEYYVSLLPGSLLETQLLPNDPEPVIISFRLCGVPYMILNGGPNFRLNEAASIMVTTPDQAETDRLWTALITEGGSEGRCGWLKDRWGVSWQIVPEALSTFLGAADRGAASRAHATMMSMSKIEIAELERAFRGEHQ